MQKFKGASSMRAHENITGELYQSNMNDKWTVILPHDCKTLVNDDHSVERLEAGKKLESAGQKSWMHEITGMR